MEQLKREKILADQEQRWKQEKHPRETDNNKAILRNNLNNNVLSNMVMTMMDLERRHWGYRPYFKRFFYFFSFCNRKGLKISFQINFMILIAHHHNNPRPVTEF